MPRGRKLSPEQIVVMGRQIEGPLAQGKSLALACTGPASPSRTQGRVPEREISYPAFPRCAHDGVI